MPPGHLLLSKTRRGSTPFLRSCEAELSRALEPSGHALVDRAVKPDPFGGSYVYPRIAGSAVQVWLYTDGANVDAPGVDGRFERWDWRSPEDLITAFISAVLAALAEPGAAVDAGPST